MKAEELKLTDLAADQTIAELVPWKEYVIDRLFLLRAKVELVNQIASISMKYRAQAAKLESQKFMEISKAIEEMR